jgi:hypothetical protein
LKEEHMPRELLLPQADGVLKSYRLSPATEFQAPVTPLQSRIAYAAAHVVCDPLAEINPTLETSLDWETTLAYRHYLWSLGLSVAEAMDTAQRGMGLNWETTKELIRRSMAEARSVGGNIACGAGTDHLEVHPNISLEAVEAAYDEQCGFVEAEGGQIILMASRALAACAKGPDDYARVYSRILAQISQPVIIHWLGDKFDPALTGYWGSPDIDIAMEVCLNIVNDHIDKVDGIKISLLDQTREIEMRSRLPETVKMYTGDDFNYPELICGDELGYSHALLGIFDAIAPAASAALQALDAGDVSKYKAILAPTVPLSRHIFRQPTYFYKTGLVFMAYLNGHQSHFRMVAGLESARSIAHLVQLFILADQAGLWRDPDLAAERMRLILALAGVV